MRRVDLVKAVQAELEREGRVVSRVVTDEVIAAFMRVVADTMARGGRVVLTGTGVLRVVEMGERKGSNPRTGEPMVTPPRKKVRINMSKSMQERLA